MDALDGWLPRWQGMNQGRKKPNVGSDTAGFTEDDRRRFEAIEPTEDSLPLC